MTVERASNGNGYDIGAQLYALNDEGNLTLDVGWTVYNLDGVARDDEDCQIVVRLEGPGGEQQSKRFSACDAVSRAFFHGWPEAITTPGEWTASITDELTELSTDMEFTVKKDRDG